MNKKQIRLDLIEKSVEFYESLANDNIETEDVLHTFMLLIFIFISKCVKKEDEQNFIKEFSSHLIKMLEEANQINEL